MYWARACHSNDGDAPVVWATGQRSARRIERLQYAVERPLGKLPSESDDSRTLFLSSSAKAAGCDLSKPGLLCPAQRPLAKNAAEWPHRRSASTFHDRQQGVGSTHSQRRKRPFETFERLTSGLGGTTAVSHLQASVAFGRENDSGDAHQPHQCAAWLGGDAELGSLSGSAVALAPESVLVHQSACIWSSRALTSRLPIFRTAAMMASCSALGRDLPASQL